MSEGLRHLLEHWHPRRADGRWVLGTVFRTEGPCYRKAGAMMLLSEHGEHVGLLSGGCLEADIGRHARSLLQRGGARTLSYDSRDEGDIAYQLGLGCGGAAHIVLHCIGARDDDDLGLQAALFALRDGRSGWLELEIPERRGAAGGRCLAGQPPRAERAQLQQREGANWLRVPFRPEPELLVVGGGVDARPLVSMASELGWFVTVCDPRPAFARPQHFPSATQILKTAPAQLPDRPFDAAVVMSHNVDIDAEALGWLTGQRGLRYLGLLGPRTRKSQVMARAGLSEGDLPCEVCGPAGLPLGGELPADIALSILAQCQATLRATPLAAEAPATHSRALAPGVHPS